MKTELVELLVDIRAEGTYLPAGTTCVVEHRHQDTIDLRVGDILFWTNENNVRSKNPTDEDPTEALVEFNNKQAYKEGWGVFSIDGGPEYRILKLDDPKSVDESFPDESPFADDREAFQFVVEQACKGSTYHRRALDFVPWAPKK